MPTVRMKTIWLFLLPLWVAGCSAAENLAVNGGFEQGTAGWTELWTRHEGVGSAAIDQRVKHSGNSSLRIEHKGERDWAVSQEKACTVRAGDILEISLWMKAENLSGNAGASVVAQSTDGKVLRWIYGAASTHGTHDWRRFFRRFVVPKNCSKVLLRITGSGRGTIWVDDVSLVNLGNVEEVYETGGIQPVKLANSILTVELNADDGSLAITDKRIGHTYTQKPINGGLRLLSARMLDERSAEMKFLNETNAGLFTVKLTLAGEQPRIRFELSDSDEVMPEPITGYPFPIRSEKGDFLVIPLNEGILYPVDDPDIKPPRRLVAYSGHGISMNWFGLTDMKRGVMAIIETPDDMFISIARDAEGMLAVLPSWEPSFGKLRYPRAIRYIFFADGGYVAQAKAYRRYVREIGLFKSLEQKRRENPNVDKFIGAADIWIAPWEELTHYRVAKTFKNAGVENLLVNHHAGRWKGNMVEEVEKIKSLGYLVSRYDTYRTGWLRGKPPWAFRHIDDLKRVVKNPRGKPRRGWVLKTKEGDFPGYEICSVEQLREAMQKIPEDLARIKYQGRFIDTTTAAALSECYDPAHPINRTQDKQNKTRLLGFVCDDCKLITGSETGQDWAVPVVHYFEGMMSIAPYRVPDAGRNIYKYIPPTDDLLKFQVGSYYRVPLWELVYHDSVVAYWYWGDGSNKQPEIWDLRDLWNILYATPPLLMINKEKWQQQKDRMIRCLTTVCPVVRKAGYQEMVNHEFLTPDHTVQRTTFSNGLRIVVNFGEKEYDLNGRKVPPKGYLLLE